MKDNISPEDKLLRLIRGQKKPNINRDNKSLLGPVTKEDISINQSISPFTLKHLSFLNIHKIILLVFVASCIYLIVSFIYPLFGLRKVKLPEIEIRKVNITDLEIEPEQQIKHYEFYLEGIRNRRIFSSVSEQERREPAANVNVDLIKEISLVGIISGENPVGIIEDKKTQKTYYVTKGQFIQGWQVEDIQEGKVVLNFNGQKLELYL